MNVILGFLWTISPASLYIFPKNVLGEGLPKWPTTEELVPDKPGNWHHWAKNYFAAIVRADPFWWGQCFVFTFWLITLIRLVT